MNDTKHTIWHYLGVGGGDTATDQLNNKHIAIGSMIWGASLIVAALILTSLDLPPALKWTVALAPNFMAYIVIRQYLRFLRMTDELQRKIQIEGLAIGFGTGYAFSVGYLVLEAAGAPAIGIHMQILVMTVGWLMGNHYAMRRYQ